jgi:hypothetical protein
LEERKMSDIFKASRDGDIERITYLIGKNSSVIHEKDPVCYDY